MTCFIHKDFLCRLRLVSQGRYVSRWLRGLGLSGSVVDGLLNRGKVPSGQTLLTLQAAENVNLSWLLLGGGTPYLVEQVPDAADRRARMEQAVNKGWTITVVTDTADYAAVLTQRPALAAKDAAPSRFTQVRILTDIDAATLSGDASPVGGWLVLPAPEFRRLVTGELGTYDLVGDSDHPGLLARAQPMDEKFTHALAESAADYHAMTPPLSPVEAGLISSYRRLNGADRRRLRAIAATLHEVSASDGDEWVTYPDVG